jgi:hypothetical protein
MAFFRQRHKFRLDGNGPFLQHGRAFPFANGCRLGMRRARERRGARLALWYLPARPQNRPRCGRIGLARTGSPPAAKRRRRVGAALGRNASAAGRLLERLSRALPGAAGGFGAAMAGVAP